MSIQKHVSTINARPADTYPLIAIDQYGKAHLLPPTHPRKHLLKLYSRERCERMWRNDPSVPGGARHVGYIVGSVWFELFRLVPWKTSLSSASGGAREPSKTPVTQVCDSNNSVTPKAPAESTTKNLSSDMDVMAEESIPLFACENCSAHWAESELLDIKHLEQRVSPGEPMPDGECRVCHSLCHRVEKPVQPSMDEDLNRKSKQQRILKQLREYAEQQRASHGYGLVGYDKTKTEPWTNVLAWVILLEQELLK